MEKEEHSFVSCGYERKQHRTNECVAGILPELGLYGKSENRRGQYCEPWEGASALSLQDVRKNVQRQSRNDV